MGTINYGTNNYINIGLNVNEYNEEIHCDMYNNIVDILDDYYFYYYDIELKLGYYEGFYIKIDENINIYDNYIEKQEAQKELTQLKEFLNRCIDAGLVEYNAGWCTGYNTKEGTKEAIKEAIKKMRLREKNKYTWSRYTKEVKEA